MAEKGEPNSSGSGEPSSSRMWEEKKERRSRNQKLDQSEASFRYKVKALGTLLEDNHIEDPDGERNQPKRKNRARQTYREISTDDDSEEESKRTRKGRGRGRGCSPRRRSGFQRWKKSLTFEELEDEEWERIVKEGKEDEIHYFNASVPPSKYPFKHFCEVCGFKAPYTCVQCGTRFCSVKCSNIHKETRCLKYLA